MRKLYKANQLGLYEMSSLLVGRGEKVLAAFFLSELLQFFFSFSFCFAFFGTTKSKYCHAHHWKLLQTAISCRKTPVRVKDHLWRQLPTSPVAYLWDYSDQKSLGSPAQMSKENKQRCEGGDNGPQTHFTTCFSFWVCSAGFSEEYMAAVLGAAVWVLTVLGARQGGGRVH